MLNTDEKKPWQHGYALEDLKKIERAYEKYNSYALGPFAKYKKNNIAADLNSECLFMTEHVCYRMVTAKVRTPITMYQNVVIGYKMPGDTILSHVCGETKDMRQVFDDAPNNTWTGVWAEDKSINFLLTVCVGWELVGHKITTFGEIYNIWFKEEGVPLLGYRQHPIVDPVEQIAVKCIHTHLPWTAQQIGIDFSKAEPNFQDHYSNYNKKHSWSAVSLRGYSTDPLMIEKPIEMSKEWKKTHEGWEELELTDTPLHDLFPAFNNFITGTIGDFGSVLIDNDRDNLHRVRFMKLAPGGGELSRHTDQVDPDSGLNIGKVARIHIPIYTNDAVGFSVWNPNGDMTFLNMKVGEAWVLDTRKPHKVVNHGTTDRIHLVIDVKVTPKCKALFLEK